MTTEFHITPLDCNLQQTLQQKIDNLNKPKGSLGRLEELALQIGMIQQSLTPHLHCPHHILFGADHGIEHEGVSISPREVTYQQMVNFTQGGGGVNMFCRQHGVELVLVDVGVDHELASYPQIHSHKIAYGTNNFLHEAAMSEVQMNSALEVGARTVSECYNAGCNIISIGEMGIGNTSPSAVWMHLLTQNPLEQCVGAGAGLNQQGVHHKLNILSKAVENFHRTHPTFSSDSPSKEEVVEIMRWFGGFEMVAAIGAMLRAAELRMTVLVDGFIMTACMLIASRLHPEVMQYAVFCHEGDEAGHRLMLQNMGVRGLLQLSMRLGEGTGALCAYPLLQSAVNMLNEMNNFDRAHITKYF